MDFFLDMVKFKTAQIIFKACKNLLPGNPQKMYFEKGGSYKEREEIWTSENSVFTLQ